MFSHVQEVVLMKVHVCLHVTTKVPIYSDKMCIAFFLLMTREEFFPAISMEMFPLSSSVSCLLCTLSIFSCLMRSSLWYLSSLSHSESRTLVFICQLSNVSFVYFVSFPSLPSPSLPFLPPSLPSYFFLVLFFFTHDVRVQVET